MNHTLTPSPRWTGTHHAIMWWCMCGYAWDTKNELRAHIQTHHPAWTITESHDTSPDPSDHNAIQLWAEAILVDHLRPTP